MPIRCQVICYFPRNRDQIVGRFGAAESPLDETNSLRGLYFFKPPCCQLLVISATIAEAMHHCLRHSFAFEQMVFKLTPFVVTETACER